VTLRKTNIACLLSYAESKSKKRNKGREGKRGAFEGEGEKRKSCRDEYDQSMLYAHMKMS
jgi:hypothetical protein